MKVRQVLTKALTDTVYLQFYLVFLWFLTEIPLLMPYTAGLRMTGLVWGALCLLTDLCTARRALHSRYVLCILAFLLLFGVTVLLNRDAQPAANLTEWVYTGLLLLVLYPDYACGGDKQRAARRVTAIALLLCVLTLIASLISLGMFAAQYSGSVTCDGTTYPVGFVNRRLTGVYRSAICPTAALGILAAVSQWHAADGQSRGRRRGWRAFLLCVAAVNWIELCLAYARALVIGLMAAAGMIAFFTVRSLAADRTRLRRLGAAALAAIVCAAAVYGGFRLVRKTVPYLPQLWQNVSGQIPESGPAVGPVNVERYTPPGYGTLTGRTEIWEKGLRFFAEKPLFGHGAHTLSGQTQLSVSHEPLTHFHNIVIQALVSSGALGTLPLCVLFGGLLYTLLRRLVRCRRLTPPDRLCLYLTALLVFLFVANVTDTTILYMGRLAGCLFWSFAGYALILAGDAGPAQLDRPLVRLLDRPPAVRKER